jgi:hypothetical protein
MVAALGVVLALALSGLSGVQPRVAVVVEVSGTWSMAGAAGPLGVGAELGAGARVTCSPGDAAARLVVVSFDGKRHECAARAACRAWTAPPVPQEAGLFARMGEALRAMVKTEKGRAVFTMSRGVALAQPALVEPGPVGLDLATALVNAKGPVRVTLSADADAAPTVEAQLDAKTRSLPATPGLEGRAWLLTARDESGAEHSAWVLVPTAARATELRAAWTELRARTASWKDAAAERRVLSAFLLTEAQRP